MRSTLATHSRAMGPAEHTMPRCSVLLPRGRGAVLCNRAEGVLCCVTARKALRSSDQSSPSVFAVTVAARGLPYLHVRPYARSLRYRLCACARATPGVCVCVGQRARGCVGGTARVCVCEHLCACTRLDAHERELAEARRRGAELRCVRVDVDLLPRVIAVLLREEDVKVAAQHDIELVAPLALLDDDLQNTASDERHRGRI